LIPIAIAFGAVAGCRPSAPPAPNPCPGAAPALLELHLGSGALVAALHHGGAAQPLCDAQERPLAILRPGSDPRSLAARAPGGELLAAIAASPGDEAVLTAGKRRVRLHDDGALLRLLDEQGVPLAQLGRQGERAIAFDPGGRPLASAERAQKGDERRAVHEPDGTVRFLLLGLRDDRAAAAFALEALSLPERFLLARWLDAQAE
jgi:hypothetical protein